MINFVKIQKLKLIKPLYFFCALLALLNTVDVHALSHMIDGDNHAQIENCEVCEEFVINAKEDHFHCIVPDVNYTSTPLIVHTPKLFTSTESFILVSQTHSGKYFNKPPPFAV